MTQHPLSVLRSASRNPRVYLAGKIHAGVCWRSKIDTRDPGRPFSCDNTAEALDPGKTVTLYAGCGGIDVVGPFFVSCDHGCAHGGWQDERGHGVAGGCIDGTRDSVEMDEVRAKVHAVNVGRIKQADFVFACIDEVDCFGTIAEIGVAYGAGVPVHLFFGENLTLAQRYDFWFVACCATQVYERIHLEHAFERAIKNQRQARR